MPFELDWKDPDYVAILRERAERLDRIRKADDPERAWLALDRVYSKDPVAFIDDWAMTFDPRLLETGANPYIPFILFDKQREYVEWLLQLLTDGEEGIVEKCRDMGATWLCVAFAVWLWLFRPGAAIGFGANKLELVDQLGDPKSILEKARVFIKYLPVELRPGDFYLLHKRLVNRDNGATIIGEGGPEIGRGGRATMYFIDEAAFLEQAQRVEGSLSETSRVKVWVSTVNGLANPFARKRHSGVFPVFIFDWRDDPRKSEAWYQSRKEKLDPHVLAREIDRDYFASVERVIIPGKWVSAAREIGKLLEFPEFGGGVAGLDVGEGGTGLSVYIARFGPFVDPPVSWSDPDTTATAVRAMEETRRSGINSLNFDPIGVGSGVSSTLKRLKKWKKRDLGGKLVKDHASRQVFEMVRVNAVNVGDSPSQTLWPDGKRSKEKFANLKAELWWLMRDRFEKTHETYLFLIGQGGKLYPPEELIVLPNHDQLAMELTYPTWNPTPSGKISIESKGALQSRGIASPDFAESLSLTMLPRDKSLGQKKLEGLH